ncbi:hypothetical protein AL755_05030 [Arthrobacter sp. ERGS1:01]|uniref:YoaK family protein n=1 Tax=Arthrobacter sp. ERGS1:01 TaxID=1704044 RepID=UPI0006B57246|nr:YoaK family protein [Arthrobacter sp. ERGS1:01]ALE05002.1 hypothetical protein AL755_05030 [Arthrobacter sp. ERGS1:01]
MPTGTSEHVQAPRWDTARTQLWLMMALTFVTGVVDAVGYLGLDKVFTGNMTGNIVILAMGLAGGEGLPVLGPLLALFSFAGGALLAGIALRGQQPGWCRRTTALLVAGAVLLALISIAITAVGGVPGHAMSVVVACLIAAQMGSQACLARKLGVRDMTTVVVTSTLTSFAGESLLTRGAGRVWNRRAGAIAMIFVGAGVGALLVQLHMGVAIALGALLTAAVAVLGDRTRTR